MPFFILPLTAIPWPVNPASVQPKGGSVVDGCEKVFEHSTVAPVLLNPVGTVMSK